MKISDLKPLEQNPFKPRDPELKKLKKSIQEFEKMLSIRKIVIDENNVILGGNKRYFALLALNYKEIPMEWIDKRNDLTEAEKKEFIVKDNVGFGDWDLEILEDWGVPFEDWTDIVKNENNSTSTKETLQINPYKKAHILISYSPENHIHISDILNNLDTNIFEICKSAN